jgi:hypothetical protein
MPSIKYTIPHVAGLLYHKICKTFIVNFQLTKIKNARKRLIVVRFNC